MAGLFTYVAAVGAARLLLQRDDIGHVLVTYVSSRPPSPSS